MLELYVCPSSAGVAGGHCNTECFILIRISVASTCVVPHSLHLTYLVFVLGSWPRASKNPWNLLSDECLFYVYEVTPG